MAAIESRQEVTKTAQCFSVRPVVGQVVGQVVEQDVSCETISVIKANQLRGSVVAHASKKGVIFALDKEGDLNGSDSSVISKIVNNSTTSALTPILPEDEKVSFSTEIATTSQKNVFMMNGESAVVIGELSSKGELVFTPPNIQQDGHHAQFQNSDTSGGSANLNSKPEGSKSLELEVVHSAPDSVLLRKACDGTLHRAEVIRTIVSANGHVVKEVRGKDIGIVTIVDDQADPKQEKGTFECPEKVQPQVMSIISLPPSNTSPVGSPQVYLDSPLQSFQSPPTINQQGSTITTLQVTVPVLSVNGESPMSVSCASISELSDLSHDVTSPPVGLDLSVPSDDPVKEKPSKGKKRKLSDEEDSWRDRKSSAISKECAVCQGPAGPHSYYGGQVCTSCRAFFRRSVTSKASVTYFCVKDGDCEVTSKTRKQCQFCRYKKCESAGMKASWVLTETKNEKKEDKYKTEKLSPSDDSASTEDCSVSESENVNNKCLTDNELLFLKTLSDNWEYGRNMKSPEMDTILVKEIIRILAFGGSLSKNAVHKLIFTLKRRIEGIVIRVGNGNGLSKQNRNQIMKHTAPLLIKFFICNMTCPTCTWDIQLKWLFGTDDINMLRKKLLGFNGGCNHSTLRTLKYHNLIENAMPADLDVEEEKELVKAFYEIGSFPSDENEFILVSMLILFNSEVADVSHQRTEIDKVQNYVAEILFCYLNQRYGKQKGLTKYVEAVYMINKCQTLSILTDLHFS